MHRGDPRRHALRVSPGRWTSRRSPSWDVLWAGEDGDDGVIPTRRVLSDRIPWATAPASPSAALYNPQGARLCGPAASSNSSYVPCYQPLCESHLSTPARHIRSYPFWVNPPRLNGGCFRQSAHFLSYHRSRFTQFTSILGNSSPRQLSSGFPLIHAAANLASFLAFRGLAINESTF